MKIKNILSIIVAAAIAAGCSESTGLADSERIVLEIEYINYAWTPTYFGFFVDASGRVFRYDRNGATYPHQDATEWSVRELADKFGPIRNQVTTRPSAEIADLSHMIDAADGGPLSPPRVACADAGTLTHRAYRFDTQASRYTAVPLRVEGDFAQENTSQAAQQLIAYIRSLDLIEELLGCDP